MWKSSTDSVEGLGLLHFMILRSLSKPPRRRQRERRQGKVCIRANVAHQAGAYPGFRSMKRLGVFLLPPGWDASPSQVTPSIKFAGTHLYTWVGRGTVRVKCLAQEHNTMSPARAWTRTARSGVERTNHEATAPPKNVVKQKVKREITVPVRVCVLNFCTFLYRPL